MFVTGDGSGVDHEVSLIIIVCRTLADCLYFTCLTSISFFVSIDCCKASFQLLYF